MIRIFTLILLYLYYTVGAEIRKAIKYTGDYTLVLVYNNETIAYDRVLYLGYDSNIRTLKFLNVKNSSAVENILCRITSQQRDIYGPNGCENPKSPRTSLQSANCIADDINVELYRRIFYSTWYLYKNDNLCYLQGGLGDIRLCAGPLRLAIENQASEQPFQELTSKKFLSSQMQFLMCLTGPFAMSPCVVRIKMVLPSFILNSNCIDEPIDEPFNGTYSNLMTDPYPGYITDMWKYFINNERNYLRLGLKRASEDSVNFRIVLYDIYGLGDELNILYESEIIESSLYLSERLFLNWVDTINFGYNYTFTDPNTNDTCWGILTYSTLTSFNILPPEAVTAANVSNNIQPRIYYRTSVCNICYGRYDAAGRLMCPGCPELDVCGGYVKYVLKDQIEMPIFVPPNPNLKYTFDCFAANPKSPTFINYAGIETSRMNIDQEMCFTPFLDDALIDSNVKPNEKMIQCRKLGGYTISLAQTHCGYPVTTLRCMNEDYYYFDNRCFYIFDPDTQGQYSSAIDQADIICSNFLSQAQPLVEVDHYTERWLFTRYMYLRPGSSIRAAYRVPVFGQPYCSCYLSVAYINIQCPCYALEVVHEGYPYIIFSICFYYISVAELEPLYADVAVSMRTAYLWKYGQIGPASNGLQAVCNCFVGSTGNNCETLTCPFQSVLAKTSERSTRVNFFLKCYANNQGACYNGQSAVCQCNNFQGPSAAILPEFQTLYKFINFPCSCPSGVKTSGSFIINGQIYNETVFRVPCTSSFNGECVVPNNTNIGYCGCTLERNILTQDIVPSFDGKGCSCATAIPPWKGFAKNGAISSEFCNHHGTCCPHGETYFNPFGYKYDSVCYDAFSGDPLEGCSCDNGKGGPVCVCTTPFNLIENVKFLSFNNGDLYYKDAGRLIFGRYVNIIGCGDGPILAWMSNEVGKSSRSVSCNFNDRFGIYFCDISTAYQFLVVKGIDLTEPCITEVYDEFFEYCGRNETVNPFSGLYYAIANYQSPNINIRNPSVEYSPFGCGYTDCMCNSLYGGANCGYGVSAIRYITTESVTQLTKIYCGQQISLANFINPVAGRGYLGDDGNCTCNPITNVDYSGLSGSVNQYFSDKACEIAQVYNSDKDAIYKCAGHGIPISSSFPYGECEEDKDRYETDSLYYPFVERRSTTISYNQMQAVRDSYFVGWGSEPISTLFPTVSPNTPNPTKAPTKSPTTEFEIILFSSGRIEDGNIGSSETTNQICYDRSVALGMTCRDVVSWLSYTHRSISSFDTLYNFPATSPVKGPTGLNICQWNLNCESAATARTLTEAGVVPSSSPQYLWTGGWTADSSSDNCEDFTLTSGYSGWAGRRDVYTDVFSYSYLLCASNSLNWMCGCIRGSDGPTKSPTIKPTTRSPTLPPTTKSPSKAPTKVPTQNPVVTPTTKTPTYTPTTAGSRIVWYYSGQNNNGDIGTVEETDSICESRAMALGIPFRAAVSMLTYPGRVIDSFPTLLQFNAFTTNVYSPDDSILCTWSNCFGSVLAESLKTANVFPTSAPTPFWTGMQEDTGAGWDCDGWSTSSSGNTGFTSLNNVISGWFATTTLACNNVRAWMCMLIQGTATPSVPTPPTTQFPSNTPTTLIPTSVPTTGTPSVAPTTTSPTKTPTAVPTLNPTVKSPTNNPVTSPTYPQLMNREMRYMYKLPQNGIIEVYNAYYNISLSHIRTVPVNLTLNTLENSMTPILWKNLIYRVYNLFTGLTETKTLDFCNPGMPSWIPGEYQVQDDGYSTCPTVDKCILTVDCTDDLTPVGGVYPDLRACYCSYDEIVYPLVAPLSQFSEYSISLYDGALNMVENKTVPRDVIGTLNAANFIDRTLNCQFSQLDAFYDFQFKDEPIKCYNSSNGRFFGAFNQQNPNYMYKVNRSEWTEDLYRGVASVMNNKVYLKNGKFADPFSFELWNKYYWIDISTSGNFERTALTLQKNVYQSHILQTVPYMYELVDIPPPLLNFTLNDGIVETFDACYAFDNTWDSFNLLCKEMNWTNKIQNYPLGKLTGLFSIVNVPNITVLSLDFIQTVVPGNKRVTGIEVYNNLFQKCGGVYNENGFAIGLKYTITCLGTNTFDSFSNTSVLVIRFLGQNSIYDLPSSTLNSQYFPPLFDTLSSYVSYGFYSESYLTGLNIPLAAIYDKTVDNAPVYPNNNHTWPQRQWYNSTFDSLNNLGFQVYMNFTYDRGSDISSTIWKNVSDSILQNNIYPFNYPLSFIESQYDTAPVDYSDDYHLQYLYNIWSTWLYQRQCGADDVDCQTLGLGNCIVETDYDRAWLNLADPSNVDVIGDEGGCKCFSSFEQGFYKNSLLCGKCQFGYGPLTLPQLQKIFTYNTLVSTVYSDNLFPAFKQNITVDEFESYYSCRYPSGEDPVATAFINENFCAGHGVVSGFNITKEVMLKIWDSVFVIACNSVSMGDLTLELFENVTSYFSLPYVSSDGNTTLLIQGDSMEIEIFLMKGNDNVYTCLVSEIEDSTYPKPFRMSIACDIDDEVVDYKITCQNDLLLSVNDTYVFNDIVYTKNPFIFKIIN